MTSLSLARARVAWTSWGERSRAERMALESCLRRTRLTRSSSGLAPGGRRGWRAELRMAASVVVKSKLPGAPSPGRSKTSSQLSRSSALHHTQDPP